MKNEIRKYLEWTTQIAGASSGANNEDSQRGWLSTQAALGADRLIPLAMVLAMAFGSVPTFAGTQAEYRALQQWCVGRDKWTEEGRKTNYPNPPEYFHFHHYCGALNAMKSLYTATSKVRMNYAAQSVMGETGYVINHVPESHTLMPEVYALRGKAMAIVKQNARAETNLVKALQLDPKHVGAYATLANLYFDTKRRAKAEETVKTGLSVDSQNKALRRMASDLGIKVEALKPEDVTVELPVQPAPKAEVVVVEPASAPAEVDSAPTNATSPEPPKIGSPTNPWCRFCPDAAK